MQQQEQRIGPKLPSKLKRNIYCMIGDEPLIFQSEEQLNALHLEHAKMMKVGILFYTMALLPASEKRDTVILDTFYTANQAILDKYMQRYKELGLEFSKNILFEKQDEIYKRALELSEEGDNLISICYSYALNAAQDISKELKASIACNSKIELVKQSQKRGFSMPKSGVVSKMHLMAMDTVAQPFLVKTDGIGGGYNVKEVTTLDELKEFTKPFTDDRQFIVQQRLDKEKYMEGSADFCVTDNSFTLLNISKKLTDNNKWLGNQYFASSEKVLNAKQMAELEKCIGFLQQAGYCAKDGLIAGIDFFYDQDKIFITEINARWTGGLPAALLRKKLGGEDKPAIAYVDEISRSNIDDYLAYCSQDFGATKVCPVSFGPSFDPQSFYVWTLVMGDHMPYFKTLPKYMRNFME